MPDPADALIELGVVRGAYGVRGWVRVAPYSPDAEVLRAARRWWLVEEAGQRGQAGGLAGRQAGGEAQPRELEVIGVRRQGAGLVAKWRGCDDPEAAERVKGMRVAVSRSDFPELPPGQYYWLDLVGLLVVNRAGLELGRVTGLRSSAAHDLLEIGPAGGGQILVPLIDRYVDEVDRSGRVIRVDWDPEWLN